MRSVLSRGRGVAMARFGVQVGTPDGATEMGRRRSNGARRLTLATLTSLCALVGVLALGSAPAFAAAPEAPELSVGTPVPATSASLHGVLNPKATEPSEAGSYEFLYKPGKAGCAGGSVAPVPPGLMTGVEHEEVSETLSGLTQNTEYTVCLRVENTTTHEEAVSPAVTLNTALPPEAPETKAASEVGSSSAKLNGVLNPNHAGEAGSYEFLYRQSTTECQGEGAVAGIANGLSPEPASDTVTGLLPGSVYTVCLLARNGAGETEFGNPVSFITAPAAPTVGEVFVSQVSSDSAALHGFVNPGGADTTYRFEYGPSTAYGKSTSNDAGAGHQTVPVRANPQDLAPDVLYHYRLVASNEAGEVYGADHTFTTESAATTFALPDGREWEMVSPPSKNGAEVFNLRTAHGGDFQAAENGEAITYITSLPLSSSTRSNPFEPQVISRRGANGWTSEDLSTPHNGASSLEYGETEHFTPRLDELEEYYAFSPDLSRAYVLPEAQTPLVPGQPAPELGKGGKNYLGGYVRDMTTGIYSLTKLKAVEWMAEQVTLAQGPPSCDASSSPAKGVEVDAVSRDGCYVYFNSESVLAPGASGPDPLYVSHYDGSGWQTTFISSLSGTGAPQWGGDYVELSPDGRYVAFMSELSLSGYDNRDALTGELDEEVYLYDATQNRLVCASCNPSGARPMGQFDHGGASALVGAELLVDRTGLWEEHRLAGVLPGWSLEGFRGFFGGEGVRIHQPRYVTDSGQLFFDSPDSLAAQDVNGLENVYEYEPGGLGGCTNRAGCISLISSGTSNQDSALVDVSASGNDVFFITSSRLTSRDVDDVYDMYDTHVCSASVPCQSQSVSLPACETSDSCKAPPSPQSAVFGEPASATFSGAGNVANTVAGAKPKPRAKLKAGAKCRKGLRRNKQGRCISQKTKTKAKRSSRGSK